MDPHEAGADLRAAERLFIVSNRGPLSIIPDDDAPDGLTAERGAGGLVTALGGLAGRLPVTWIAAALGEGDRLAARRRGLLDRIVQDALPDQDLQLVLEALPREVHERHYRVFANPFLWFLQHGLANEARRLAGDDLIAAWHGGYVAANARLAAATIRAIAGTPRPLVWVHDYQLYLVSEHVRAARPDATLAHFSHIPWPAPEAWSILPPAIVRSIVDGLLANDVVTFQTRDDARRFLATVAAVSGRRIDPEAAAIRWDGRRVTVSAHPITLEAEAIRRIAASPEVERRVARLRRRLAANGHPRLVVRVDRLDPTKNALRGFLAFEDLLARRPELAGGLRFLAVMAPSRAGLEPYERYAREVEAAVRRIGGDRGGPVWVDRDGGYEHALAALRTADVVLVNSVADGMNLVAKEAALVGEEDPVLVLSRAAGVAHELGPHALIVDPYDVAATSRALERAVSMPGLERRARAAAMRQTVASRGIDRWLGENLSDMAAARRATPGATAPVASVARATTRFARRMAGRRIGGPSTVAATRRRARMSGQVG